MSFVTTDMIRATLLVLCIGLAALWGGAAQANLVANAGSKPAT